MCLCILYFIEKTLWTDSTGPAYVNSIKAKLKLIKSGMFPIYVDCTTTSTILLLDHHLYNSIVSTTTTTTPILWFAPQPPPPQFYCFHHHHHRNSLIHNCRRHLHHNFILPPLLHNCIVFIIKTIKDCVVLALAHFIAMQRVVKNHRGSYVTNYILARFWLEGRNTPLIVTKMASRTRGKRCIGILDQMFLLLEQSLVRHL